jgi:hypothetical protein
MSAISQSVEDSAIKEKAATLKGLRHMPFDGGRESSRTSDPYSVKGCRCIDEASFRTIEDERMTLQLDALQ